MSKFLLFLVGFVIVDFLLILVIFSTSTGPQMCFDIITCVPLLAIIVGLYYPSAVLGILLFIIGIVIILTKIKGKIKKPTSKKSSKSLSIKNGIGIIFCVIGLVLIGFDTPTIIHDWVYEDSTVQEQTGELESDSNLPPEFNDIKLNSIR